MRVLLKSRGLYERWCSWVVSFGMDEGVQGWTGWVYDIAFSVIAAQSVVRGQRMTDIRDWNKD